MGFWIAWQFLTIIPSPFKQEFDAKELGRSAVYFPLVGAALGVILVGLDYGSGKVLPLALVNALLIAAMAVLSGATHLDGFIDVCDGLAVGRTAAQRWQIMSDANVGSFGVVGACCLFLVKYLALAAVPNQYRWQALILMPTLSRWAMVYSLFAFASAKREGIGWMFRQQVRWQNTLVATLIAVVASVILMRVQGLALMFGVWLLVLGLASYLARIFAGLTGDTYGAINEVTEVLVLILVIVVTSIYF